MEGSPQTVSPQLVGIGLPDSKASWEAAGFTVENSSVVVGPLTVSLETETTWSFDPRVEGPIDGMVTGSGDFSADTVQSNPNGANGLDHVVVSTPNLDRTTAAFKATGFPHRKTRPIGDREQRFFWAGQTIIELVGPVGQAGHGPSSLWGLALVSSDLDGSKKWLGERLSDPREAVQPGRRIAAIRTRELGISLTIALMTPHEKSA